MLYKLRLRLTLWFVSLSILLYLILSILFILVFNHLLTDLLNEELRGLLREIRPSIVYIDNKPTLKTWASVAKSFSVKLLATIQLYGADGKLLEEYGPSGAKGLYKGVINFRPKQDLPSILSYYRDLEINDKYCGFLQIQLSTKTRDDALNRLTWTIAIIAPFLLAGLGITGYFFSATAIEPTEKSFQVLRQFMADAGHELTTPLTVIQASIETIENGQSTNNMDPEIISVMLRSITRMSDLARDLMLLAKMEIPQLVLEMKPVSLANVLKIIYLDFKESFEQKRINFNLTINTEKSILAHEESIRALINNLLQNALRYTDNGGSVSLSLEEKNNHIILKVKDTGIGIPKENIPYIFNRFYRVEKSRSRAQGGSGLGLAIVKAVCEAHNALIKVDSDINIGTTFTVSFAIIK